MHLSNPLVSQKIRYYFEPISQNVNHQQSIVPKEILEKIFSHLDVKTLAKACIIKPFTNLANKQIGLLMLEKPEYFEAIKFLYNKIVNHAEDLSENPSIHPDAVKRLNLTSECEIELMLNVINKCQNLESLSIDAFCLNPRLVSHIRELSYLKTLNLQISYPKFFNNNDLAGCLSEKLETLILLTGKTNYTKCLELSLPSTLRAFKTDLSFCCETLAKLSLLRLDIVLHEDQNLQIPDSVKELTLRGRSEQSINLALYLKQLFSRPLPHLHSLTFRDHLHITEGILELIPPGVKKISLINCTLDNFRIFARLPKDVTELYLSYTDTILDSSNSSDKEIELAECLIVHDTVKYLTLRNPLDNCLSAFIGGEGLLEIKVDIPGRIPLTPEYLDGKAYDVQYSSASLMDYSPDDDQYF